MSNSSERCSINTASQINFEVSFTGLGRRYTIDILHSVGRARVVGPNMFAISSPRVFGAATCTAGLKCCAGTAGAPSHVSNMCAPQQRGSAPSGLGAAKRTPNLWKRC